MRAEGVYAAPYLLNAPLHGGAVGEVLESGDNFGKILVRL